MEQQKQEEHQEKKESLVHTFEHNDQKWVYDNSIHVALQTERARAAVLFKINQDEVDPLNVNLDQIYNSGGADWKFQFIAHATNKVNSDGEVLPFNLADVNRINTGSLAFFQSLPSEKTKIIDDIIQDFFLNTKMPLDLLKNLLGKKNSGFDRRQLQLLKIVVEALMNSENDTNVTEIFKILSGIGNFKFG